MLTTPTNSAEHLCTSPLSTTTRKYAFYSQNYSIDLSHVVGRFTVRMRSVVFVCPSDLFWL